MYANLTPMIITVAICAVIVLTVLIKSKRFFSYFILSSLSGIGSLFAVNLLSEVTGVSIALNYITLSVSSIFGISGVIALVLAI